MHLFKLAVQPDDRLAQLIADRLAAQMRPLIEKELAKMSTTLNEAVSAAEDATKRAVAKIEAVQADNAAKDATIADLQTKLAAASAGDPSAVAAIDAMTAALDAAAPAPPAPEPAPAVEPAAEPVPVPQPEPDQPTG